MTDDEIEGVAGVIWAHPSPGHRDLFTEAGRRVPPRGSGVYCSSCSDSMPLAKSCPGCPRRRRHALAMAQRYATASDPQTQRPSLWRRLKERLLP